ncbi:hypothetical protein WDU94_000814 [Cyamophila willieti]
MLDIVQQRNNLVSLLESDRQRCLSPLPPPSFPFLTPSFMFPIIGVVTLLLVYWFCFVHSSDTSLSGMDGSLTGMKDSLEGASGCIREDDNPCAYVVEEVSDPSDGQDVEPNYGEYNLLSLMVEKLSRVLFSLTEDDSDP